MLRLYHQLSLLAEIEVKKNEHVTHDYTENVLVKELRDSTKFVQKGVLDCGSLLSFVDQILDPLLEEVAFHERLLNCFRILI